MRLVGLPSLRVPALAACAAVGALALAGCATTKSSGTASADAIVPSGGTLSIYVSPPLSGAGGQAAQDVLHAEELAFGASGERAGPYRLRMVIASGSELSAEARDAVSDKTTIAYLGEIEPGLSGVSAQITNELDILQVSPTDTAAYLTQSVPAVAGSPDHFYPDHKNYGETFARIVPTTIAEAKALVAQMQSAGVHSLAVTDDGSEYGQTIAAEVRSAASSAGLSVSASASGAGALFYGGLPSAGATHALDAAVAATPSMKLYAGSGLYDDSFVAGLSSAAQKALTVSAPGIATGSLDSVASSYVQSFTRAYGHAPAPQAIFGYEAMRAVVATLQQAGAQAAVRKTVVADFRALQRSASDSAVGAYSINGGDSGLADFVFARVVDGTLVPRAAG